MPSSRLNQLYNLQQPSKVLVSKKVAAVLDKIYEKHLEERAEIVESHFGTHKWEEQWEPLGELNNDEIIRALYVGYEVIKTPEEKLLDIFNEAVQKQAELRADYWRYRKETILDTLNALSLKIEGVNT